LGDHAVAHEPGSVALGPLLKIYADGTVYIGSVQVERMDPRVVREIHDALTTLLGLAAVHTLMKGTENDPSNF
jgi:hypothetical protein